MTHYRGLPCSSLFVLSETEASAGQAWDAVAGGLGLAGASEGESIETAAGTPRVCGVVESVQERGIVVRTEVWREWLAERLPGADAQAERPVRAG